MRNPNLNLSALLLWFVAAMHPANAYIDLGSGSYFLQVLLAAVLGSLFYVKTLWQSLLRFFRRKGQKDTQNKQPEP